jgi:hypothetical protein
MGYKDLRLLETALKGKSAKALDDKQKVG